MGADLTLQIAQLPGYRQFLNSLGEELYSGRSVWVLFPDGEDIHGFEDTLIQHLEKEHLLSVGAVDLAVDATASPQVLGAYLYWDESSDSFQTVDDLIRNPYTPDVLVLRYFGDLAPELAIQWRAFIADWAERNRVLGERKSICIIAPAILFQSLDLPVSDVRLSVRFWYGILSNLETQLACRMANNEMDAISRWREVMIPSLVGNDLVMGDFVWDVITESPKTIFETLNLYARDRGWNLKEAKKALEQWQPGVRRTGLETIPSMRNLNLWARGWLVFTLEYGEEIHSALLALMKREQEVLHRIWRAQTSLLLPMVDDIRLSICDYMLRHYDEGWTALGDRREQENYVELGRLENILRKAPLLQWERQEWLDMVVLARYIRNNLAHYQLVRFENFAELYRKSETVRKLAGRIPAS